MNIKNKLFKIITLTTAFAVGITLAINHNTAPTRVEAAQHNSNYGTYTYSGDYYKDIDFNAAGGMNGALRTSIQTLITPKAFYSYYKSGETHLSTQLQYCDEDPTNEDNMVYFYTRNSVAKNPATTWNREHVWCQSLSNDNWGTTEGGTDLLHLRPTYNVANSTRNNFPYGDVNKTSPKYCEGFLFGYLTGGYFEPLDCVKGDVARIIMYVWTTYNGYKNYNSLNILSVIKDYNTLLSWHTMDKPDMLEGNRNDYVQTSRQENRNPFVDHPELAWKIFGDQASSSVKNACMEAYPGTNGGGQTIDPTGISLNKTSASVVAGRTLQLRANLQPAGASGTVTWTTNNTNVATVNSAGLITAKTAGTATITATVGTYSASCAVTVTEAVISYGTLENPISVADAIEIIDITGTSPTPQPLYVKGIVSSNDAYSTQYSNYYHVWLENNQNNVADSFQLFKAKASTSITNTYDEENELKDLEIVCYGYGQKYNNTYELTSSNSLNPANPQILSVNAPSATDIELDSYAEEINVGETVTLNATLVPSNSESAYTWVSSDESVATVENGVVTGVSTGTAIITARVDDDIQADCVVTVINAQVNGDYTIDLTTNNTTTVTATQISWVVSNIGSVVCDKASAGTATNNYYGGDANNRTSTRFYKNSVLTITPDDGIELTSAVFSATTDTYASDFANSSWTNATTELDTRTVTVTPDDGTSAFSAVIGNTCGFTSIVLNYEFAAPHVDSPYDYIDKSTSFVTLNGRSTVSGSQETEDSIVFANLNLDGTGGTQYLEPFEEGGFSVTFAGGDNDGKYYSTGSAIRTYGGGTITVAATGLISKIEFVWHSTYKPTSSDVVNAGTYNVSTGVWTGSATSVVLTRPSGSGNWRLQSVTATYMASSITVDHVSMRFGASISIDDWTEINTRWGIDDFGVICLKKTTLDSYASEGITTAKDAFTHGKAVTKLGNKNNLEHPYQIGDNYVFTVKISVSDPNNYGMKVCAIPYIYAGNQYYFFNEIEPYCVRSLAKHYLDNTNLECALPNAALRVLKGNYEG